MKIVCNASPLILLSKIERLSLFDSLFERVLVPRAVWDEVNNKSDSSSKSIIDAHRTNRFEVFNVVNRTAVNALLGRLHKGEVEVIIGASEVAVPNVILDDGYARSKAKQMGLSVTGTLGLLLLAHKNGLIADLWSDIEKLKDVGFWISDNILNEIRDILNRT